jgi:hypothetical protein
MALDHGKLDQWFKSKMGTKACPECGGRKFDITDKSGRGPDL